MTFCFIIMYLPNIIQIKKFPILTTLIIFIIAISVRVPALNTFFTADEFLWVRRSRNFLGGLLRSDYQCLLPDEDQTNVIPGQGLECTLRTGHPGVVTLWTGTLGISIQWLMSDTPTLYEFVKNFPFDPVDKKSIIFLRLPSVIINSIFVAAVYLLLRKIFQAEIAFIAGLLIALNPFHIALSRVLHHDALSTTFIITSALSMIIYFGIERQRKWIMLAGVLTGIAMLSKTTGWFLVPYMGLLSLWQWLDLKGSENLSGLLKRTILDGILWATIAITTFILFWPAMWVIPMKVLNVIFAISGKYAKEGHSKGVLLFGDVSPDPGIFFYGVTWLLRTNIWVMLGLIVLLFGVIKLALYTKSRFDVPGESRQALTVRPWFDAPLLWIVLFVFFFLIVITFFIAKKQDRYALPIYPMLDILAGVGLYHLVIWSVKTWSVKPWFDKQSELYTSMLFYILIGLIFITNLAIILPTYPYYFTYYNPIVGGINTATNITTIGWGEGLNEAAEYLNQKPNAENLTVASWYGSTIAPFFRGKTLRYSHQKGTALGGDYVVFYINQLQRTYPDEELWRYLSRNYRLEKIITLNGVDYAWIFTGYGLTNHVENQRYKKIAGLLGWEWHGEMTPNNGAVMAGHDLPFSLFWEHLGKVPEEQFFVRLIGADGNIWAEAVTKPTSEFSAVMDVWRYGQIIEETGMLTIPSDMPPADYNLQIGFYTQAPAILNGELTFPTPNIPLDHPLQIIQFKHDLTHSINENVMSLAELKLHNSTTPKLINSSTPQLNLNLTWSIPHTTNHIYHAGFVLLDDTGKAQWTWSHRSLIEFLPTTAWLPNIPLRSQWHLPIENRTPGGDYQLQLQLFDETGQIAETVLQHVRIPGRERNFSYPENIEPIKANFENKIHLLGTNVIDSHIKSGDMEVTLYWQAINPMEADYTIFVQLLDADGKVHAQHDSQPLAGNAPTSTWTPNEIIHDKHVLNIPNDLPAGKYQLIVGLYFLETGERLSIDGGEDFIMITVLNLTTSSSP